MLKFVTDGEVMIPTGTPAELSQLKRYVTKVVGLSQVRREDGGPGSGNFGHLGRPGEVGGSGGGSGSIGPGGHSISPAERAARSAAAKAGGEKSLVQKVVTLNAKIEKVKAEMLAAEQRMATAAATSHVEDPVLRESSRAEYSAAMDARDAARDTMESLQEQMKVTARDGYDFKPNPDGWKMNDEQGFMGYLEAHGVAADLIKGVRSGEITERMLEHSAVFVSSATSATAYSLGKMDPESPLYARTAIEVAGMSSYIKAMGGLKTDLVLTRGEARATPIVYKVGMGVEMKNLTSWSTDPRKSMLFAGGKDPATCTHFVLEAHKGDPFAPPVRYNQGAAQAAKAGDVSEIAISLNVTEREFTGQLGTNYTVTHVETKPNGFQTVHVQLIRK